MQIFLTVTLIIVVLDVIWITISLKKKCLANTDEQHMQVCNVLMMIPPSFAMGPLTLP